MSDILTNEEINALKGAYCTSENQSKSIRSDRALHQHVRLYDFARPDKFNREHIKTLNSIHSKYATCFSVALTSLLHSVVQAELLSVDQVAYREYCVSVPENTLFCDINLEPLTGTAIFEFNPAIAGSCIDGLTGGSQITHSQESELTDIDKAIMIRVVDLLLKEYQEAWHPYISLRASVREADLRGSFNQIFLPTEPVLVCAYEVQVGQSVGMMSICIPAGAVEAILPNLAVGRAIGASSRQTPVIVDALHKSLEDVEMECSAILGRTTLTMGDIMNLREGDIIRLDNRLNSEVEFWVGDKQTCLAIPGRSGKNLGLRVTRLIKDIKKTP